MFDLSGATLFARYVIDSRSGTLVQFLGFVPTAKATKPSAAFQALLNSVTGI